MCYGLAQVSQLEVWDRCVLWFSSGLSVRSGIENDLQSHPDQQCMHDCEGDGKISKLEKCLGAYSFAKSLLSVVDWSGG